MYKAEDDSTSCWKFPLGAQKDAYHNTLSREVEIGLRAQRGAS